MFHRNEQLGRYASRIVGLVVGIIGGVVVASLVVAVARWRRRRSQRPEGLLDEDNEW